jgi:hypothetical protein
MMPHRFRPPSRAAVVVLAAILAFAPALPAAGAPARGTPVREVLGAAHAAGRYNFTKEDFLNEGADVLLTLGTRVIKVWFVLDPSVPYPFNHDRLPVAKNLVALARRPVYQELFAKPFTTYFLVIPPVTGSPQFLDGMSAQEVTAERNAIEALARHLLTTYAGSGKTFVLQNWEGDHLLRQGLAEGGVPDLVRQRGMRDWWNARQDGVDRARRALRRVRGVTVAHAVEVNRLAAAMAGEVTAVNQIVPKTRADLYSYSSWDLGFDPQRLTRALDYLAAKAPDSALYGARNIVLGEIGAVPDQLAPGADPTTVVRDLTEAALGWGVRWALYWQVYCNEAARTYRGRPRNSDLRGFWLVRPDGTRAPIWDHFARRLANGTLHQGLLAAATGQLAGPVGRLAGGPTPRADRWWTDPWARWTLTDLDGGSLDDGDRIAFQSHDGLFLAARESGGIGLDRAPTGAVTFRLWRVAGPGPVASGDEVVLQALGATLAASFLGVGLDGSLRTDRPVAGAAETFRLWLDEPAPVPSPRAVP